MFLIKLRPLKLEGKRLPGRPYNAFIGRVKKNTGTESYRALKENASERIKLRKWATNQPTGWKKKI